MCETVARSKCPLYVGTTGILVQEMKCLQNHHKGGQTEMFVHHISVTLFRYLFSLLLLNCFSTAKLTFNLLPYLSFFCSHTKRNSVFAVKIDVFVSHIYCIKFKLSSSEQSAKVFKVKGIIDL